MLFSYLIMIISQSPEIHSVRFIPGDAPSLVITGRNLYVGSEYESKSPWWSPRPEAKICKISVNGQPGVWDNLFGASDEDANRGLHAIQLVRFPAGLAMSADALVEFERFDGAKASTRTFIPANRGRSLYLPSGQAEVISSRIVIPPGQTLDLGGKTLLPSSTFRDSELVRYSAGSRVINGRLVIPEDHPGPIRACLRPAMPAPGMPSTFGLHVSGLVIEDLRKRGIGIETFACSNSIFLCTKIVAHTALLKGPTEISEDNLWYECEFSSPTGRNDGCVGNVMGGSRNLIFRCRWHDIDRGPTASCWGSPLERTTFFECHQWNTGWTQGASEGLLYEGGVSVWGNAVVDGTRVQLRDVVTNGADRQLRVGYHIVIPSRNAWARITDLQRVGATSDCSIITDRPLPAGTHEAFVGNTIYENNFIRCRFQDGKAGLFLFGVAAGNHVCGCSFDRLRGGIVRWDSPRVGDRPKMWSFEVGRFERVNWFRDVQEPNIAIPNTRDWPK